MNSNSTIIVPFYFREKIENQHAKKDDQLVFSKQHEPTPITLFRHWSTRTYPRIERCSLVPTQEVINYVDQTPAHMAWKKQILDLAQLTRNQNEPLDADSIYKQLSKNTSEIIKSTPNNSIIPNKEIHKYESYLHKTELIQWRSLWPQLEKININNENQELDTKSAQKIINHTKELINKETVTILDRDNEKTTIIGLNAGSITQVGLSSSMKHMWSLDDSELSNGISNSEKQYPSQGNGLNLISGRSLILSLPLDVINNIFGTLSFKIKDKKNKGDPSGFITISRIIIVLMPDRNGYCCFTYDIKNESNTPDEALKEIQELIYSLTRASDEFELTPYKPDSSIINHPLYRERAEKFLPSSLCKSCFTLKDLTLWLISLDDIEGRVSLSKDKKIDKAISRPLGRCGHRRKYPHHTSIHLTPNDIPDGGPELLRQQVWRAARAVGIRRNPASFEMQKEGLLVYNEQINYNNLILGSAREGSCALSWDDSSQFNISNWGSSNYQGIYLLLYLHVLGEEAMLEDLSYQSLELIKNNISLAHGIHRKDYLERLKIRDNLKHLIYEMVYLNLSFSSATTGGSSDYMQHILSLKSVYSINDLRDELRNNISELSDIVDQIDQEQQQRFENGLTVLGAIVLPFGLLSGLMGMNNFTLSDETLQSLTPSYLSYISFSTIILSCVAISIFLLFMARNRIIPMLKGTKIDLFSRKNKTSLTRAKNVVKHP